jgi:DNA-binding NtrC family response regulator
MSAPLHLAVLEGDVDRRRLIVGALRAAGLRVFETGDARVAVESLEAGGFDAVVVSLALPELEMAALRAAICPSSPGSPVSLDAAERAHIARTLAHAGGNRRRAALILGISRSTLLHKIRKYGLDDSGARRRYGADGGG